MSNCIEFVQNEGVVFTPDEIDVEGFQQLVASSKHLKTYTGADKTALDANMAWWYLQTNSHVIPEKGVAIWFGKGRSSHTNRDFQGVLMTLAPLIKRSKRHTFIITDEFDGHQKLFKMLVDFKIGAVLR